MQGAQKHKRQKYDIEKYLRQFYLKNITCLMMKLGIKLRVIFTKKKIRLNLCLRQLIAGVLSWRRVSVLR